MKTLHKLFILCIMLTMYNGVAQTAGLIYKPAGNALGKSVLDPNNDGFASPSISGFSGTDYGTGSELQMIALPVIVDEPLGDLTTGSAGGHTDIVTNSSGSRQSCYVLVKNVGGIDYDVLQPDFVYTKNGYNRSAPFPTQLSDNFSQSIGLSLSIPIFNSYNLRTQYLRSKLNISTLQLQKEQDDQKLKQDIYQAYTAALTALEKFNASRKAVESAEKTYSFAGKRFDVGLLGTFDLITTQNNLLRSKLEYSINHFDYVFKMKVLEFYKGQGLKL